MKKVFLLFFTGMLVSLTALSQPANVDSVAVMILDRMSGVIGDLYSCSFRLSTSSDVNSFDNGTIKQLETNDVYMVGPDKMLIHSYGERGHRGYWYNGEQLVYYSFDENNFATIATPSNIISTIDTINKDYGIEFPAADFFYPTFTDDILAAYNNVVYLGLKQVDNQECFHILASNKDVSLQIWIANDAYNLPKKFIFTYKNKGNMQYEGTFSNFLLNPEIPATVFEFLPPPMASKIDILPISQQ
jgi:hypothetical protein